jgi:ceramide synthetase
MCERVVNDATYETLLFDNPLTAFSKVATTFGNELVRRLPERDVGQWFVDSIRQFIDSSSFSVTDLKHVVFVAIGVTVLRYVLCFILLNRIPMWFKMTKENARKFPESSFNATMYSFAWLWELYIIATSPRSLFYDLASHYTGWTKGGPVVADIYWLYMFQLGFYSHFLFATIFINTKRKVFATIFVNTKRKDFWVLLLHHFITLALITWSYAIRFHYIGVVLLFLHDIGDVLLESGKTVKYFEILDGKKSVVIDTVANIIFGIFTLEWILCRLYWYPIKVLQSSGVVTTQVCINIVFYLPFNVMLILLYLMQVYWFYFILKLLYKVLVKGQSADDNREYDVQEKWKREEEAKKKL